MTGQLINSSNIVQIAEIWMKTGRGELKLKIEEQMLELVQRVEDLEAQGLDSSKSDRISTGYEKNLGAIGALGWVLNAIERMDDSGEEASS
tara:strand:- start:29 stop:301 length:273 start_codon:yes stop_codon:yes gene_type:complete